MVFPAPIITLHLLSPCTYYHPAPIITMHLLSPCTYYHPAPIITIASIAERYYVTISYSKFNRNRSSKISRYG